MYARARRVPEPQVIIDNETQSFLPLSESLQLPKFYIIEPDGIKSTEANITIR